MALPNFRRVNTKLNDLKLLQDSLDAALRPIIDKLILDGRLIEDIELTTGQANLIDHRLGRSIRGYVVVKRDADARVWDSVPDRPATQIDLRSSANVTISIWVF